MYICAFCSKVKSLTITRAFFAHWEIDNNEKVIPDTIKCHHCVKLESETL